jgi:hypothetical protein
MIVALLAGAVAAEPALPSAPVQRAQPQPALAPAIQPAPQQRAAMLKQWMQASLSQLRSCQWIETTAVSVKGEQKSQVQKRCHYGADGALQKLPVGEEPAAAAPRGPLRKRIAEHRKEELTDYMKSAVALNVTMPVLPDGTIHARRTRLDAPAENLSVVVENSGYRLLAQSPI